MLDYAAENPNSCIGYLSGVGNYPSMVSLLEPSHKATKSGQHPPAARSGRPIPCSLVQVEMRCFSSYEEADDLIGIEARQLNTLGSCVVCSIDKDLKAVNQRRHYDFVKEEETTVSAERICSSSFYVPSYLWGFN